MTAIGLGQSAFPEWEQTDWSHRSLNLLAACGGVRCLDKVGVLLRRRERRMDAEGATKSDNANSDLQTLTQRAARGSED